MFMLILNGISGAQLLWSVFISTKQILSSIYSSLIMNVAYMKATCGLSFPHGGGGWCPTQTAYSAYSIVHIAQTGAQGHFSVGPQGLEPPAPRPLVHATAHTHKTRAFQHCQFSVWLLTKTNAADGSLKCLKLLFHSQWISWPIVQRSGQSHHAHSDTQTSNFINYEYEAI